MTLTRRRFLSISAAAVARPRAAAARETARWAGVALGARAGMTLAGITPHDARPVFARLEAEIARLERIFSLYRDDSALVRLNRAGRLPAPPPELLEVLTLSDALHAASDGAFDPSVQPLWRALATGGDAAAARAATGWHDVRFDEGGVRLLRSGMALTLNGIAQGYVTDRIAALLRSQGLRDVLVDIGEVAALGRGADGRAWRAGIATPAGGSFTASRWATGRWPPRPRRARNLPQVRAISWTRGAMARATPWSASRPRARRWPTGCRPPCALSMTPPARARWRALPGRGSRPSSEPGAARHFGPPSGAAIAQGPRPRPAPGYRRPGPAARLVSRAGMSARTVHARIPVFFLVQIPRAAASGGWFGQDDGRAGRDGAPPGGYAGRHAGSGVRSGHNALLQAPAGSCSA